MSESMHVSSGALAARRVLVTGATGFIGSRLCRRLGKSGTETHGVSRQHVTGDGVRWWTADLANYQATQRLVQQVRPEIIFHLAGHASSRQALDAVLPTARGNLLSTIHLLTAASETGVTRVVLAGSMEGPEPEDADPLPGSPYSAAKAAGAMYASMFHACYGLPVVNLRVSMVYGPGQRDGAKLVPYVTRCLLRGEAPVLSTGRREIDWIYVDDVVEAFVAAAGTDNVDDTNLDVGSGELTSIRTIVEQLVRLTGATSTPQFGALPDRSRERSLLADIGRTRQTIGWGPSTPLVAGLASTVRWFKEQHDHA